MLLPSQFGAGTLAEVQPLSLVVPRDKYEEMFIVGSYDDKPFAVCLSEKWKFLGMPCEGTTAHGGLIIPNVGIEVDDTSLFKVESFYAPIGSLVRDGDGLFLGFKSENSWGRAGSSARLMSGLPDYTGKVGFSRWSVSLGEGRAKRTLHMVDLAASADQP